MEMTVSLLHCGSQDRMVLETIGVTQPLGCQIITLELMK